jgi:6-phosphogluconolactonase
VSGGNSREIVVESGAAQLAENTAARVITTLVHVLGMRPVAHLVLTGGGILEEVMAAIRQLPARDSVDWDRVHVWWGDERFVPAASEDRNDKAAFARLLSALPLDPAKVHRMPAADGGFTEPEAAAQAYADELAAAVPPEHAAAGDDVPHFDLTLLGIGPDGHCASLFPEHPGVYEEQASVIAVRNSPKPPPIRLSLTFRALDAAAEVWFVASGSGKAKAVAMAFSGAGRVQVPSAGVRGQRRTLWLIDHEAAADLPRNLYQPPVA